MRLVATKDVELPQSVVFEDLCDFRRIERAALNRGAKIRRLDDLQAPAPGMAWAAVFDLRGMQREGTVRLRAIESPGQMLFSGTSSGLEALSEVELVALSPRLTRIAVRVELRAATLRAQLILQPLKLIRGQVQKKFASGLSRFGGNMERRLRGPLRG